MATQDKRPMGSLSLDLDNLWSYLKIHGDPAWKDRPSYLPEFVPYMLDVLDRAGLKITFFVVGIDAEDPVNAESLRAIVARGHEIGNHSFEHEPWLSQYSDQALTDELDRTDKAIKSVTGIQPIGFRGPGFSWSPRLLELLQARGYRYDASILPTWLGPIARTYYFWTSGLNKEERKRRKDLFGHFTDARRPNKPFRWSFETGPNLLEIPVTTIPLFRTPFHFSYLAFLARYSKHLMRAYLAIAIVACKMTRTAPSFLLHPLDVIGGDQAPALKFFPGMELSSEHKTALLLEVLNTLSKHFKLEPMSVHAAHCRGQENIREYLSQAGRVPARTSKSDPAVEA
ncbi:MAG: polysaccharide deacetylase family protein [Burkholderiaceae bacterium]